MLVLATENLVANLVLLLSSLSTTINNSIMRAVFLPKSLWLKQILLRASNKVRFIIKVYKRRPFKGMSYAQY